MNQNIMNNASTNILGETIRDSSYSPLTKDEEQKIINIYKNDPEKARSLLIQHNIRLVFNMAKKYSRSSVDFDELIGRGMEGLCIAAKRFDFNKGIKFITYATPWVFKYILKEYSDKDTNAQKTGVSLTKQINQEAHGDKNTFMDVVNNYFESSWTPPETILSASDQSEINEKNMIYDDMVNYVQTNPMFDETDKKIFNGNFIYRKSIRKISDDLNMDYSVTTKKKYEIMYKLKSFLHKKYGIDSLGDIQ